LSYDAPGFRLSPGSDATTQAGTEMSPKQQMRGMFTTRSHSWR